MTDHDAAAREPRDVIAQAICDQFDDLKGSRATGPTASDYDDADTYIAALSAAGFSIARTPEVGMVTISVEDARELFRALPILSTRRQEAARYALYEAIERAEGETG